MINDLIKKIYDLKELSNEELEVVRDYLATSDFIFIETSYKTIPRKILTKQGILNIVDDLKTEANKPSGITDDFAYGLKNIFSLYYPLNDASYKRYYFSIIIFFVTHKQLFLNYLNAKHNLTLTLDDISKKSIINTAKKINETINFKNLRNLKKIKKDYYIRVENKIIKYNDKIYLIGGKNDRRSNVSFEYRRTSSLYKNESNFRIANDA